MRLYFINDKSFKDGPYDLQSLKSEIIHEDTPVWFAEVDEWVTAGEIEEFEFMFADKASS